MNLVFKSVFNLGAVTILAGSVGWAQVHFTFDLPDINLLPNQANQRVDLTVVNDTSPTANNLVGGVNVALSVWNGASPGPDIISGISFKDSAFYPSPGLNGTSGAPEYEVTQVPMSYIYSSHTTTSGKAIFSPGGEVVLTLIFDTTGLYSGTFAFTPNVANGVTADFELLDGPEGDPQPFDMTLLPGTITVPEPTTYAAVSGVALLAFANYRRFRR